MSKSDRLKAEIAFHEKMFFAALAMLFAIVGWTIEKADTISDLMLIGATLSAVFSAGFGLWNYRQIHSLFEELEDAE